MTTCLPQKPCSAIARKTKALIFCQSFSRQYPLHCAPLSDPEKKEEEIPFFYDFRAELLLPSISEEAPGAVVQDILRDINNIHMNRTLRLLSPCDDVITMMSIKTSEEHERAPLFPSRGGCASKSWNQIVLSRR
ncbi:hypothetical protein PROFUN_11429 [Planoprotostelium fungivorum]|uniref:Uncharacterized protein n=1 Tax=Planoprotostelium fungivorum TaxID=1890364 RepID=A0A2P6NA97_9EUKA|nr:hypothetical protein PROFUN_11429 [Planoprotostelium fungivorum]